jgi:hypothetical protein
MLVRQQSVIITVRFVDTRGCKIVCVFVPGGKGLLDNDNGVTTLMAGFVNPVSVNVVGTLNEKGLTSTHFS